MRRGLGLFGLGLALFLGLRLGGGLWGALGTDAALWGGSALDLAAGNAPLVPPLYPALIALLRGLGLATIPAGWALSTLAAALVPALGAALGSRWGLGPRGSVALGLLLLASPELAALAQQVQPDALLWASILGLALLLDDARPGAAGGVALLGGLLPLLREHGLPLALLALVALAARRRWAAVGLLVAVALLGPVLLGGVLAGPQPWSERAGGALAALTATDPGALPFLNELHRDQRRAYLALVAAGDRLGQLRWHATRSLTLAGDLYLAGLLALGSAQGGPLRALALATAALPALLIWSQRRHVSAFWPLLVVILGVGAARSTGPRRFVAGMGLVATLWSLGSWPGVLPALRQERPRAEGYAAIGGWICAQPPGVADLIGGVHQDLVLYCPRPRHDPDGSAADTHTAFVGDDRHGPPPTAAVPAWRRAFADRGLVVYLPADGPVCPAAAVAPGARFISVGPAQAALLGCSEGPPRSSPLAPGSD